MDKRPDPDQILSQIQREAAGKKRGKLKIFLGYAAGVGKTYAMLDPMIQVAISSPNSEHDSVL